MHYDAILKIHHINCGTMCPPFARFIQGRGGFFERARIVCHCLIVETNSGLVLVDTGIGISDIEHPNSRLGPLFVVLTSPVLSFEETALSQLKQKGFSPKDVRHIIPTHLDVDHAGGLSDFPDAAVHVLETEKADALNAQTFISKRRYRRKQFSHGVKWQQHDIDGEQWLGFESVRALPRSNDDVLLVPLYGHTRSHCGVAVKTKGGWILHAGDAYYAHEEVYGDPPSCPPGLALFQWMMQRDGGARRNNQRRLHDLIRSQEAGVQVICAHDAAEMDTSE